MRPRLLAAILALILAVPAAAAADPRKEEALSRYQRGLELHEEGDHAAALAEFRRAYELAPAYKVLFNIGQLCYVMQDYACAHQSFQKYLDDGGKGISSQRRAEVERDLGKLNLRVGTIEVVTRVAGADVFIDDLFVGKTPLAAPVLVNSGRRSLRAVAPGRVPEARMLDVAGTDAMRVELAMLPLRNDPPVLSEHRWRKRSPTMTVYSWVGVGVAGASALTAGVSGVIALAKSSELKHTEFTGGEPSPKLQSLSTQVKTYSAISDVALGVSVVTLAATLALTFLRGPTIEEVRPEPRVRFEGNGVHGVF